uniref:Uncharacterized protein n=1 Tax=Arundo donax TaxID=35708 RepID=A0A0A9BTE4_ARUDO
MHHTVTKSFAVCPINMVYSSPKH